MAQGCGEHCPFLNRSDRRCSSFLSLDRISHAFDHCFGEYQSCPVYLELLVERRVRRLCGPADQTATPTDGSARRPVVRLTIGHSHAAAHAPAHAHCDVGHAA